MPQMQRIGMSGPRAGFFRIVPEKPVKNPA